MRPFQGSSMNFIERFLGFTPDIGDVSLEAVLLIALVVIAAGIVIVLVSIASLRKQTKHL